MNGAPWRRVALVLVLAGCSGGDPSGPQTGSLAVAVSGLPGSVAAAVSITGPGGYSQNLTASQTLGGLAPGSYAVTATQVTSSGSVYAPSPASQAVTVSQGSTPTSASVTYVVATGSLTVTIAGLPGGTNASVAVAGPGGYNQNLTATQTLTGVPAGTYTITAQSVSSAGDQYDPSPSSQTRVVPGGGTASASVSYTVSGSAALNLRIDGLYLTQSVQDYAGLIPLVEDRDGYLRVFVVANQANAVVPVVRVRLYSNGSLISTVLVNPPGLSVPQAPNEASLANSWNVAVSKTLIQPNLSILADVDPDNLIAEGNESDNSFPSSGTPAPMDVRTTPNFNVRFVPILQSVNGRQGAVSDANKAQFLTQTMKLHPVPAYSADVRAPLTTNAPAVDASNSNSAWNTILQELDVVRQSEGGSLYYFGVLNPNYSSGVAGIAYVNSRSALGWDKLPSASSVAAHEWGHNWSLQHAPGCSAPNPDPLYPSYPSGTGTIGLYGLDVETNTLKPPTSLDVMGYCSGTEWISGYHYNKALLHRDAQAGVSNGLGQAVQPVLMVWGWIANGRPVLEPAFQMDARPNLPSAPGPYALEARAADGTRLFDFSFSPVEVADDPTHTRSFTFAVPLRPDRAALVASLRVSGPGGEVAASAAAPASLPVVEVRRGGGGRVSLRWDATRHPLLVVRDPATGQILSLARNGATEVLAPRGELALTASNRVHSRDLRVAVPAR